MTRFLVLTFALVVINFNFGSADFRKINFYNQAKLSEIKVELKFLATNKINPCRFGDTECVKANTQQIQSQYSSGIRELNLLSVGELGLMFDFYSLGNMKHYSN